MINKESMINEAYETLKANKGSLSFKELWDKICEQLDIPSEERTSRISRFYTDLSLDGRFVGLQGNNWDLRERKTFDEVHINMNEVYSDEDDDVEDEEELDEELAEEDKKKKVNEEEDAQKSKFDDSEDEESEDDEKKPSYDM